MPELEASEHNLVFMQDNARPHKAKLVSDYYDESQVEVLDWLPQSPGLYLIKQGWVVMKQNLYTQDSFPSNRSNERILTIWVNLELGLFENLSDSIPERLEKVIKNKWI